MSVIVPHWFQDEAIRSIPAYFEHAVGNPVIALPTGTGKSVVIAFFLKWVLQNWPRQRVMVLTHVKELIAQNATRMQQAWPEAPIGIYSAGLKQRDTVMPITFAGVASVHGRVPEFGWRDLIIIDEAHLLSLNEDSMYQQVIADSMKINPLLKVIGLTATPYRLGQGLITDGGLFTDICYDMTNMASFNRLVAEGFIAPLVTKKTNVEVDTSELSVVQGDFAKAALEHAVTKVTLRAIEELCQRAADRQSWLIFAPGIENSEKITQVLNHYGIRTKAVHSKMKADERDRAIAELQNFELRCVVNNNVLTTGFDHPGLDCIGMLRPTLSPGLWVQMLGRGTRVSPATGKTDCLVLDFAGNTRRLGPINDPVIPRKKGAGGGDAPVRLCPTCGSYNHASLRQCCVCGMDFDFTPKIAGVASVEEVLRSDSPIVETLPVKMVLYSKHQKRMTATPGAMPPVPCMKVRYVCGVQSFDEYIHLQAPYASIAAKNARDWWRLRHFTEPPATVDEALTYQAALRPPLRIRVIVNRKYPEIKAYEYD